MKFFFNYDIIRLHDNNTHIIQTKHENKIKYTNVNRNKSDHPTSLSLVYWREEG